MSDSSSHPPIERPPHFVAVMAVLVGSSVLGPMGMSILLPSLATIGRDLQASAGTLPLVLTVYLIGLALGQLFAGQLADRLGRRPVIIGGLLLTTLTSFAAAVAPNIEFLVVVRFFQAVFAAACLATGRAVMRDMFDREKAAAALGWMVTVQGMGPTIAPTIGGALDTFFGWRAPLLGYATVTAIILLAALLVVPETARPEATGNATVRMGPSLKALFGIRLFNAYFVALAAGLSPYFMFVAVAGPIVMSNMALNSAEYGVWLTAGGAGFMIGTASVGSFTRRLGIDRLVTIGLLIGAFAVGLGVVLTVWFAWLGPIVLFGPLFIYSIGNGIVLPGAIAGAVSVKPGLAGTASGVGGFGQAIFGAGLAQLFGLVMKDNSSPAAIMGAMTLVSVSAVIGFALLAPSRFASAFTRPRKR